MQEGLSIQEKKENQILDIGHIMYYRRKLLLALIESFGGRLLRTDCIKLLFLFNQKSDKRHYDFFPYHYGGYSFVAFQDKARLEALGLLAPKNKFVLSTEESFVAKLKKEDRALLSALTGKWKNHLGKELVKDVYLQYPYYSIRSKIVEEVLTLKELKQIKQKYAAQDNSCLFSIGYEGKSIDSFLNDLINNNIKTLVDVRKMPRSMKYGFSKTKLSYYLDKAGIQYIHHPELGIPSNMRKSLESMEDYRQLFNLYNSQILPNQSEALGKILDYLNKKKRIALMCFEADPNQCHRNQIVKLLSRSMNSKLQIAHV